MKKSGKNILSAAAVMLAVGSVATAPVAHAQAQQQSASSNAKSENPCGPKSKRSANPCGPSNPCGPKRHRKQEE
jgi:uncharacterized low-complexity protein